MSSDQLEYVFTGGVKHELCGTNDYLTRDLPDLSID